MGMMRRIEAPWGLLLAGVLAAAGCEGRSPVDAETQPAAVGRPEDATAGPRVGIVVMATPDVQVVPSRGAAFTAKVETMLVRDDRLVTGPGADSFVIVELYNGHLVRFGSGTDTRIEKIAVFSAERAKKDAAQKFEAMLRSDEEREEVRGAISRVAGWNSRLTAAETIATLPTKREAPVESKPLELEMSPPSDVATPGSGTARPTDPVSAGRHGGAEPDLGDRAGEPSKPPVTETPDPPILKLPNAKKSKPQTDASAPDAKKASVTLDLADEGRFMPKDGATRTIALPPALAADRTRLAKCAGDVGMLKVKVEAGAIVEIRTGKGKTCALPPEVAVTLADGALEIRVR